MKPNQILDNLTNWHGLNMDVLEVVMKEAVKLIEIQQEEVEQLKANQPVRCGECKNYYKKHRLFGYCNQFRTYKNKTGYCNVAVRKENVK